MDIDKNIEQLFSILTELDARNQSNNCVVSGLTGVNWDDLCDEGITLLKSIKEG